jgi:TAT (twin-arginine translocation) pathway signal sequence
MPSRRSFLKSSAALAATAVLDLRAAAAPAPKKVAAVITEYRKWSHADVIIGKMLEGPLYDGKDKPALQVVSMYVDQFPGNDMSRELAKKYAFQITPTIPEALTLGGDKLAVDGVVIVGEHGKYPSNDKGQVLYPRRRFFEEVAKTFEKCSQSVPVFNDKHLAATWDDAKWMYEKARALGVPFLAGSSIPVTWRRPELKLPKECAITGSVQLGYGPIEGYGFHALEGLQSQVERRKGGETGVKAVQCLQGKAMWEAMDQGRFSKELLEEAIQRAPATAKGDYRELTVQNKREAAVFLVEYHDGLTAAVAMLNGFLYEGDGGAFCFACQLKGEEKPRSTHYYLQQPDPFAHFGYLVKAIESLIQTGKPPYPVERTLLTTGILDAVMTSRHEGGKRIETPHLEIKYTPTDWPFATDPVPKAIKR